ncbi:DUF3078 domain-containing protein [Daejeonella oryzae]|uniref:DUF3078 domain-containing protein n=1 Tax=Daejeonella oryzae TaxID=1122943 RepID=UPI00040F17F4|nr:DUF3078 domain-containing protein [Daejeonella oryzae]
MLTRFLILFFFLSSAILNQSKAQDTIPKPDTLLLNELRQYPRKNSLPVGRPNLTLKPIILPESEIDIRMNYWRNWISFGINFNQASFSDNWSSGGVNTLALGSQFNYKSDYTKDDKNFVSEVLLQYGKLKNRGQLERKTNDRIFWDNKVALKLSKSWYFFGSLNYESQFDLGYSFSKNAEGKETRTLLSRFMSPGYLTESIGFEYKPVKYFFVRIGTGTARQTFVLDTGLYRTNPKNFGVTPGKRFRNELAFQVVGSIDKDIASNINLKSRYAMFASYDKLSGIDHRLDLTITARVNKLINVAVSGVALYDDDTANKIQASQTLSLGLVYKINR